VIHDTIRATVGVPPPRMALVEVADHREAAETPHEHRHHAGEPPAVRESATAMIAPTTPQTAAELPPDVAWLVERAALDDETRDALGAVVDVPALVRALLDLGRPAEALRVTACGLPPREGIWWAWVAARHGTQAAAARRAKAAPAAHFAALAATERWVLQPSDAHRRAAWDAAQAAGLDSTAGCVAGAVFFTGGSVTPPHGLDVPPPPGVHVTLAATGVLLAATATDASRLGELAGAFAEQGAAVAQRLGGWDAAVAAARHVHETQVREHAEASKPPQVPQVPQAPAPVGRAA
jgi:hypothetical protein